MAVTYPIIDAEKSSLGSSRINTFPKTQKAKITEIINATNDLNTRVEDLEDGVITETTVTATTAIITNTITERTAASGVTVDSLLIKDGGINTDKGTVTQITSAATGVTLNKPAGIITTVALTTAAGATESFTCTNSFAAAGRPIIAVIAGYSGTYTTNGIPVVAAILNGAGGDFTVKISNVHGANALAGTVDISFMVV